MPPEDDYALPPMKYLHEATLPELTEALKRHCQAYIFAYVNPAEDDKEIYAGCWHGSKFTALGLCDALSGEVHDRLVGVTDE